MVPAILARDEACWWETPCSSGEFRSPEANFRTQYVLANELGWSNIGDSTQQKPKVQIKRQKGVARLGYRIYIDGTYMGTGSTRASARDGAQRMLVIYAT